jgi:hypothetical protein
MGRCRMGPPNVRREGLEALSRDVGSSTDRTPTRSDFTPYTFDLFGEPAEPYEQKLPPKNLRSDSYWRHVRALLPYGLQLWNYAKPRRQLPTYVEAVWAVDDHQRAVYLEIDIGTGTRYES